MSSGSSQARPSDTREIALCTMEGAVWFASSAGACGELPTATVDDVPPSTGGWALSVSAVGEALLKGPPLRAFTKPIAAESLATSAASMAASTTASANFKPLQGIHRQA